ncbi:MAG: hypothetical protein U0441_01245 [Polyangiaceae bacterium]
MSRARAIAELFARTSGASAASLAIPLFGGVGLVSAILFAGNGLSARDVVVLERGSVLARAAIWGGWVVLAVPPARALLGAPSAAWARSLPVAKWQFVLLTCASLFVLQAPIVLLFARGLSAWDGVGAGVLSASLAAGIASFRALGWWGVVLLIPTLVLAFGLPLSVAGMAMFPVCALAAEAGFFRGGAVPTAHLRLVRGPAPVALAGALMAKLARGERTALVRALLAAAGGGALGALGARNNERLGDGFAWLVLPIATVPLVIGSGVIAGPIARTDASLRWLLASTGTGAWTGTLGRYGASAVVGATAGFVAAAATRFFANVPVHVWTSAAAALALWGATIQVLAVFVVRRAGATGGREEGSIVAGLTGLGTAVLLAAGLMDAPALIAGVVAVIAAAVLDTRETSRARGAT